MEEEQKNLVQAQLPITDAMLADFDTFMLLKANVLPRYHPVWDGKPVVEHLWSECNSFFKPLQMELERKTAASSDHPDMFGTAATAQRYHGILPDLVHRPRGQGRNVQGIMEHLDGHFDNPVAASTNSHRELDQISDATTEQYARTTAALDNLAAAAPSKPAPRSTPKNTNPLSPTEQHVMEKWILTLQSAVKNKWKVGGFCSTYGHGIRAGHGSGNCADKKDGHDFNST